MTTETLQVRRLRFMTERGCFNSRARQGEHGSLHDFLAKSEFEQAQIVGELTREKLRGVLPPGLPLDVAMMSESEALDWIALMNEDLPGDPYSGKLLRGDPDDSGDDDDELVGDGGLSALREAGFRIGNQYDDDPGEFDVARRWRARGTT
jgi:hypothetical protein